MSAVDTHESDEGREVGSERTDELDCSKAVAVFRETERASVPYFQHKFGWGYNHACTAMDCLEKELSGRIRNVLG